MPGAAEGLPASAAEVLDFWFGGDAAERRQRWFGGGPALDGLIAARFGAVLEQALRGGLRDWEPSARGRLALVILLDQFTRNAWRGSARAFAGDERARALALATLDAPLEPIERVFLYLPFEHAESIAEQDRAVALFAALAAQAGPEEKALFDGYLEYAQRHREVIRRFGRFPHRNAALGRTDTPEEAAWLAAGGSRFGQ